MVGLGTLFLGLQRARTRSLALSRLRAKPLAPMDVDARHALPVHRERGRVGDERGGPSAVDRLRRDANGGRRHPPTLRRRGRSSRSPDSSGCTSCSGLLFHRCSSCAKSVSGREGEAAGRACGGSRRDRRRVRRARAHVWAFTCYSTATISASDRSTCSSHAPIPNDAATMSEHRAVLERERSLAHCGRRHAVRAFPARLRFGVQRLLSAVHRRAVALDVSRHCARTSRTHCKRICGTGSSM